VAADEELQVTNLVHAQRKEPGERKRSAAPDRSAAAPVPAVDELLRRELRFLPGLPYADWQEIELEPRPAEWRVLSSDEERLLFRQMHLAYWRAASLREAVLAGDRSERTWHEFALQVGRAESIRDELFRAFSKLNLAIAGRFTNRFMTFDELASEGQFTLLRAISRFDPERGFRFSTYAMHAIRRRLLRFIRQRQRQAATALAGDTVPLDTRRWSIAYEQRIHAATAAVERLLAQLSSRERYVVRARYGWGREFEPRTLREIAADLGVSRERVRQLEERSLRKLRNLASTLDVEI
jgi:RNA polymerase sigma factor (sigma-70 family)